jgi:GT2 family glycosyltransferase
MVAIITINYNLHKDTLECVQSILESRDINFRVFLVDNGSRFEDFQELNKAFQSESRVEVCRMEKNKGYVGGVNFGMASASKYNPEYYVIMNNDTVIDKDAISELVKTSRKHDDNAIVTGKVYYYDHPDVIQHTGVIFKDPRYLTTYYPGKNEKDIGQCDEETERDSLDDVLWILPAKLLNEIGYYCNYYFLYAEQGDYAQTARRKGYKLIYTPHAKIWHKVSMTTGGGNARAQTVCYWRGKSAVIFFSRNLQKKYFLITIFRSLLKLAVKSVIGKSTHRKCSRAMLRGNLAGIKWLFNKKPDDGFNPYISN